jgi:uroporphyrinogen decarboxylase
MTINLTKKQRVLNVIQKKEVDYLPSQIAFADRSRHAAISKAIGLENENMLDQYLENHFHLSFTLQDKTMIYKDVFSEIQDLKTKGFANPDWENRLVYDDWGIGHTVGVGSFFISYHPLQMKTTDRNVEFVPSRIKEAVREKDLSRAVRKYICPDPCAKGNFDDWERDLREYSEEFLVWPSGYGGIYERSYHLLGWEELMTYIALEPQVVLEIMDKVTAYKIEIAKKTVELGFEIGHCGDDFGTQNGGFFSEKMFTDLILPRLRQYWEVFHKANIPIMFHSCGNITQYIPYLIDIGLKILEPCQPCMDLAFLKKEYGKDLIFYGGIDTQRLPYLTPEQTKEMVRETVRLLGKNGGYIIAPAQEIMNDVPIENIKAMVETIREERYNVLDV